MKKFFKWCSNIIIILYIICILFSMFLVYEKITHPNKTPSVFGFVPVCVLSGSMEPNVKSGDLIILKHQNKIDKGDIITYKSNNNLITHRVTKIIKNKDNTLFKVKGDANNVADKNLVSFKNFVGVMIFKIPYGGYVVNFVKSKIGLFLFIVIPAFLLIGGELKNILSDKEENSID